MLIAAASLIAGLGLLFFAADLVSQTLKLLVGRRLRRLIARVTAKPLAGVLAGVVLILVAQRKSAAVLVVFGMVRARILDLRQAQPLMIGLHVGFSLLVLLLTVDIQIAVLLALGVAGIAYVHGDPRTTRVVAGAVLGVALLFFSLQIMRAGVAPFTTEEWFRETLQATRGSPFLAFAAGAVLAIVIQSALASIMVMVAFQHAGLFELSQAMMFVYGANVGLSLLLLALSAKSTGVPRQVALYQAAFNLVGAAILLPLFYLEQIAGVPLVHHLIAALSSDPGQQVALANMVFNAVPAIVLLAALDISTRTLQSISRETPAEQASQPKYLQDPLVNDPVITLSLIELEQMRLLETLAAGLAELRNSDVRNRLRAIVEAFESLARIIDEAIATATEGLPLSAEHYERVDLLLRIQHNLKAIRDALVGLAPEIGQLRREVPDLHFSDAVVEGLDAILQSLLDVVRERKAEDIELLLQITSEEGNGAKAVRGAYLSEEDRLTRAHRMRLLTAANYCERTIWLFGDTGRCYRALSELDLA